MATWLVHHNSFSINTNTETIHYIIVRTCQSPNRLRGQECFWRSCGNKVMNPNRMIMIPKFCWNRNKKPIRSSKVDSSPYLLKLFFLMFKWSKVLMPEFQRNFILNVLCWNICYQYIKSRWSQAIEAMHIFNFSNYFEIYFESTILE